MRRVHVLTLIGLAAVISALLYVGNGAGHEMVWTYAQCVAWQQIDCTSGDRMSTRCHFVGSICVRTEPRVQPWVYAWLTESAVTTAICIALLPLANRRRIA